MIWVKCLRHLCSLTTLTLRLCVNVVYQPFITPGKSFVFKILFFFNSYRLSILLVGQVPYFLIGSVFLFVTSELIIKFLLHDLPSITFELFHHNVVLGARPYFCSTYHFEPATLLSFNCGEQLFIVPFFHKIRTLESSQGFLIPSFNLPFVPPYPNLPLSYRNTPLLSIKCSPVRWIGFWVLELNSSTMIIWIC